MRIPLGGTFVVGLAGPDGNPDFWLSAAQGAEAREIHLAFTAPDRAAVDAVHAVFLGDRDGHNVEAVCHGEPSPT